MKDKIAIIGSGVGGLCTALRLLKLGYQVDIYEQRNKAGGVTEPTYLYGYCFDTTASIVIDPKEYDRVFNEVGLDPRKYFEYTPLDTLYRVFFQNGISLSIHRNLSDNKPEFENVLANSYNSYKKFILEYYQKYKIADRGFLTKSFCKLPDTLCSATIKSALKLSPYSTVNATLSQYFHNDKLIDLMNFQSFFMGISPYQMVNSYATVPALAQMRGIAQIKGGMSAYIMALIKAIEELGGHIYLGTKVEKILVQNRKVIGLRISQKKLYYNKVISNADYCYTCNQLLSTPYRQKRSYKMSCSVFILRLGLNKAIPQLSTHNLFIGDSFQKEIRRIFKGKLPQTPSAYLFYPSAKDKDSTNKTPYCMNIMIRVPNLHDSTFSWNATTINYLRSLCIKILKNITKLPDIENSIEFEEMLTPIDLEKKWNCTDGAAFGIGHTTFQSMMFRPQVVHPTIQNLYFVGSSIHPGNGVSIVMKGARLVVEEIVKNNKRTANYEPKTNRKNTNRQ